MVNESSKCTILLFVQVAFRPTIYLFEFLLQYFGRWYFIAATGSKDSDVEMFKPMDNIVFNLQEGVVNDTLLLTAAMNIGDSCLKKKWDYRIHSSADVIELMGRSHTKVWSNQWLNCSACIVLQERVQPSHLFRAMLYGRTAHACSLANLISRHSDLSAEVIQTFQTRALWKGMKTFILVPRKKGCDTQS
uniref:Apolipoprotein M n=1 Tax=Denticeps clupeoides TaxID=299321 RepID=A0AAY4EMJ1_9TELE